MNEPPFDIKNAHRWFAVELNNRAWELLEMAQRTNVQTEEMIHTAHAACYHWLQAGTPANHSRAECLIGNVYAASRRGDAALHHARRCLELIELHPDDMADWDVAFAYDCLARATAASGQRDEAAKLKQTARDYGDIIADPEEKDAFDQWFASGDWHGLD